MIWLPQSCTASQRGLRLTLLLVVYGLAVLEVPLRAQPCTTTSPPCVKTAQYDNSRNGYNGYETVLTSTSLSAGSTLAQLAPLTVDTPPASIGSTNPIYAQPLYVARISLNPSAPTASQQYCNNLSVNGQPGCNMLLVVTLYGSVWAYNADTGHTVFSRTGLWSDCGPNSAIPVAGQGGLGSLPFAGIVSTPVIDTSLSPPAMFLTSLCLDSQANSHWYLHEIDLTNQLLDVAGSSSPLEITGTADGGTVSFVAGEVLQRAALLEVQNAGATPANVIYISFGSAVPESPNPATGQTYPYHGWIFGYSTSGVNNQLVQDFAFATTPASGSTPGTPACNTNAPLCGASGCQTGQYQNEPNWCGHGGGIWMSGRGPAGNTANGVSNAFFGIANGGFQPSAFNWGSSILDFTSSSSGGVGATPSSSFTPQGGLNEAFTPLMLADSSCPASHGGPPMQCAYTFEVLNQNDWDMANSGILLFQGTGQQDWLVTVDKAGNGYLLNQSNLGGFAPNDTGDVFPFAAAASPCWSLGVQQASDCHRVTSLASYVNSSAPSKPRYLYFWPYLEPLTGFQFSQNTPNSGIGTIATSGSAPPFTTVNLATPCTAGSASTPCFTGQMVAGDTLTAGSQAQKVTSVGGTTLTVSPGFSSAINTSSWTYNGYFIKPLSGNWPQAGSAVGYPGGSIIVTANQGNGGVVWTLATIETAPAEPPTRPCPTLTAMLTAYSAATLDKIWSSYNTSIETSCHGPCFSITAPPAAQQCGVPSASFVLPTVVNGSAYIPTYSIASSSADTNCTAASPCSGLVVYCGTGTTACNGSWQH
jgi:hypothetical protein